MNTYDVHAEARKIRQQSRRPLAPNEEYKILAARRRQARSQFKPQPVHPRLPYKDD